ncbi:MAG TPA: Gfo/Idh/MocA family oxidoreductase [Azospirillaceae bacterium]|nr:Gfo/Idh/MocA family oxidoreductase [Azospirillaceae bacterium]
MQKVYGVALVGLGVMGMRMLERLQPHPVLRAAALYDPGAGACARAHAAAPDAAVCATAEEAAARPDVDVVYIATPPGAHAHYAHMAFDHGKAVFCEKPLTVETSDGKGLVDRIAREGRPAAVNFSLAASPAFRAVEEEVRHGAIGTPQRIEIRCAFRTWPRPWQAAAAAWLAKREEGGFTREVVSHFLFAAIRVGGPLAVRRSRVEWPADPTASETGIEAELSAGGLPVTLAGRVGGTQADDENQFIVHGTTGAVRIRDWAQADRLADGGWETLSLGSADEVRWRGAQGQLDELHAMLEGRPHRLATFVESFAIQEAIEGLLRGA